MNTPEKNLAYYLTLPYTIEVIQDRDDTGQVTWFGRVTELPGCITEADNFAELEMMIQDAKQSWLEIALADGRAIPEPRLEEDYSGRFVVRVPKSLHKQLVISAQKEGVSLNMLVNVALARGLA